MSEQKNGCGGWIPIVAVLVVLAFFILDPLWYLTSGNPDKPKETEIKQNLHAIQLALERYAVDHEMYDHYLKYPTFIMGGDWTDSYVVWQDWADENGLIPGDIRKYQTNGAWLAAESDVGDTLVMEGYMTTYPGNPFKKRGRPASLLSELYHLGFPVDGSPLTRRFVGGADRSVMHEIFGPTRDRDEQSIYGDFFVHHIYNDPPYDAQNDVRKENNVDWLNPSGNEVLVGNFSYNKRPEPQMSCPTGENFSRQGRYILAGYGSVRTTGQDVYNRNGNYKGRYRTEPCGSDCGGAYGPFYDDIPCICPDDGDIEPNPEQNNGGSDTLADGVIVIMESGPVYPSSKVDFDKPDSDF